MSKITTNAAERKNLPLASGVLDYFPDALLEVARVSKIGNEQHNAGQPLHWARGKSTDHADALLRHLVERGETDSDGGLHSAKVAWRALAMLQEECEAKRKAALAGHVHGPVGDSRGPQDVARDAAFWRPERTARLDETCARAREDYASIPREAFDALVRKPPPGGDRVVFTPMAPHEIERARTNWSGHMHGPVGDSSGPADVRIDEDFWRAPRTHRELAEYTKLTDARLDALAPGNPAID